MSKNFSRERYLWLILKFQAKFLCLCTWERNRLEIAYSSFLRPFRASTQDGTHSGDGRNAMILSVGFYASDQLIILFVITSSCLVVHQSVHWWVANENPELFSTLTCAYRPIVHVALLSFQPAAL
jgi:hypothetical protein